LLRHTRRNPRISGVLLWLSGICFLVRNEALLQS
jgi:hypothetical protein